MTPPGFRGCTGFAILSLVLSLPLALGAATWRILQVDNIQIVSNRPEKDLRELHREIHYFNRGLAVLFGPQFVDTSEPFIGLLLKGERDMREFLGPDARKTVGIFYTAPGFETFLARGASRSQGYREVLFMN